MSEPTSKPPGPIRRALCLIVGVALLVTGGWVLFAPILDGVVWGMPIFAGLMMLAGALALLADGIWPNGPPFARGR